MKPFLCISLAVIILLYNTITKSMDTHSSSNQAEIDIVESESFWYELQELLRQQKNLVQYGHQSVDVENTIKIDHRFITFVDSHGQTTLHLACSYNLVNLTKAILTFLSSYAGLHTKQKMAFINKQDHLGMTALHYAVAVGAEEIVTLLLAKNIDTTLRMPANGKTALHIAVEKQLFKTASAIIKNNYTILSTPGYWDQPIITCLIDLRHYTFAIKLLTKFLKKRPALTTLDRHGASILSTALNTTDKSGQTALHKAAQAGQAELVELLLKAGAQCNIADTNKQTPLQLATNKTTAKHLEECMLKHKPRSRSSSILDIISRTPPKDSKNNSRENSPNGIKEYLGEFVHLGYLEEQ